jgi:hypothetical protein
MSSPFLPERDAASPILFRTVSRFDRKSLGTIPNISDAGGILDIHRSN